MFSSFPALSSLLFDSLKIIHSFHIPRITSTADLFSSASSAILKPMPLLFITILSIGNSSPAALSFYRRISAKALWTWPDPRAIRIADNYCWVAMSSCLCLEGLCWGGWSSIELIVRYWICWRGNAVDVEQWERWGIRRWYHRQLVDFS